MLNLNYPLLDFKVFCGQWICKDCLTCTTHLTQFHQHLCLHRITTVCLYGVILLNGLLSWFHLVLITIPVFCCKDYVLFIFFIIPIILLIILIIFYILFCFCLFFFSASSMAVCIPHVFLQTSSWEVLCFIFI